MKQSRVLTRTRAVFWFTWIIWTQSYLMSLCYFEFILYYCHILNLMSSNPSLTLWTSFGVLVVLTDFSLSGLFKLTLVWFWLELALSWDSVDLFSTLLLVLVQVSWAFWLRFVLASSLLGLNHGSFLVGLGLDLTGPDCRCVCVLLSLQQVHWRLLHLQSSSDSFHCGGLKELRPPAAHTLTSFDYVCINVCVLTWLWVHTGRPAVAYFAGPGPHTGSSDSWRLSSAARENRNRHRPRWSLLHHSATHTVYCSAAPLQEGTHTQTVTVSVFDWDLQVDGHDRELHRI